MSKHPETQFLHQRNTDLHKSDEVEDVVNYLRDGGESIPNQPADKIHAYLGFLADKDYVNDGILTGDETSIRRQVEAHVIKAEDVPEAYFDLQRQIAREQGHGDITITQEMKRQLTEAAQADQRKSLENWVEYLGGEDGAYPDWFKYYAWESVIELGNYDKEKREFDKRSRGTTAPYPELNREALAYVFDKLNKSRVHGEEVVTDEKLAKLLQSANFGKLYAYAVHEVTPDSEALRQNIKGSWKKYDQTDDPRMARRLSESLQGHGTGWCTAGESTAASQLHMGDFYVFYTEDDRGKETIPRVAIRMQDGEVAELRGIEPGQNLEGIMSDVAMEKLQELPGGEEYIQKAEDMKRLTALEKRLTKDPDAELSKDEVKFLYEVGHEIEGFGYESDPRIAELKQARGDKDKLVLKELAVEHVKQSFEASYKGYAEVTQQINGMRRAEAQVPVHTEAELQQLFAKKVQEWSQNGVMDYVVERIVSHGELHTPVITPDILANSSEIMQLVRQFGEDQPYEADIYDNLYSQYSASELSGQGALSVSLMPSKYDEELSGRDGADQLNMLGELQSKHPERNLRVPSVLQAISYWQALRAGGDNLVGGRTYAKTAIRHFDLSAKRLGSWSNLPFSCVFDDGRPRLSYSRVDYFYDVRLSVG